MSGSSLRDAAAHGETAYLVELLKGGANPCSTDENGLCALHYAAWNGYGECVDYLVVNDLGHTKDDDGYASCVKLRTKAGWSALHIAALGCLRAEEIVERLLMAGVDPSLVDETGLTALEIALDNGNRAVAEVLSQPRPSLEARRAAMARLERAFAVVQYRDRPPRPLESDEDAASIASDEDELLESRPSTARTRFSALVVAKEDDEEEEVMTNAAPSGRAAAVAFVEDRSQGQRAPIPRELVIPEHLILNFAKENFRGPRTAGTIHNLQFATEEAGRNLARRGALVRHQQPPILSS